MMPRLEIRDDVAVLVLDRPEVLNALSFEILGRIGELLDEVERSTTRALLITGAGPKAFCAGADIPELIGRDLMAQKRGAEFGQRIFAKLTSLRVPSVAVIHGFAFGGGLEMALAATFRLVSEKARMGLPEIKLGLIPGYGGTQRLPRLIGEGRALEIIMTGRTVGAEEAVRIGLADRMVEGDPIEAGLAFIREFSGYSLPVLGFAREAVMRAHDLPINEGLKVEADLSTLAYRTDDAAEGMQAFVEKRKAVFKDA
jgi:enoyl-CoA hydratase